MTKLEKEAEKYADTKWAAQEPDPIADRGSLHWKKCRTDFSMGWRKCREEMIKQFGRDDGMIDTNSSNIESFGEEPANNE